MYLKKIGSISINRNKISKDNVDFYERVKLSIHMKNSPLIIFPQGTRYYVKERPDFKKGASRIYNLNIKCLPVVLNSGSVWPKKGVMKSNKKCLKTNRNYIKTIETRQGLKVACLEVIACQMGYISKYQLLKLAEPLKNNGYGQYLIKRAKEF